MKHPKLVFAAVLAISTVGFQSCYPDPEFDLVPSIEFREVEQYTRRNPQNALFDSLVLVVRFQDGDGNLGLSATNPEDLQGDKAPGKPFHQNYLINIQKKVSGTFQPVLVGNTPINFNGRFPRVSTDSRSEPLEGDIRFSLNLFQNNLLRPKDTIRFDIRIIDRAHNFSNQVTTPEIVLFSR